MKEVMEVLLSSSGRHRAMILRRADGLLQVELERHFRGTVDEPAHWARVGEGVTLADSIDRARELANAALASAG